MSITTEQVELSVSDGTKMRAFVARPAGAAANGPGMIVFQEAFGVNNHIRAVTSRFAEELGMTAIAPELYHRTGTGAEYDYSSPREERAKHSGAVTVEGIGADAQAAFDYLTREGKVSASRIACIGYCMGGKASYIANAFVPLAGAISNYGGGSSELPELAAKQHSTPLFFWGGLDKGILAEHRRAVEDAFAKANKPHEQVLFSFADHGFFCDERASYNADAATQAWALSLAYLRVRKVLE